MVKAFRKCFTVFVAMVLALACVPFVPGTTDVAEADVGLQNGTGTITVNSSVVAFAGQEWWIIGDGSSGVYPKTCSVTLFAKNNNFGDTAFDSSGQNSNYYKDSTLQARMTSIASNINTNNPKEYGLINGRDMNSTDDGIGGDPVVNQLLWPISNDEWETIANNTVRSFGGSYWLRSPYAYGTDEAWVGDSDGDDRFINLVKKDSAVRPALSLNLSSVLFTSSASAESSKSSVNVGDGLVEVTTPTDTIKLTVKDSSQALGLQATTAQSTQTKSVTSSESLIFSYDQATAGANQYVSCVWTDANVNDIKYYGKLADSSSAASGTLSIPLTGVADGTYTVSVFSEQANADTYTDFASNPITMKVTVVSGQATVSDFGGTVLSNNADLATVAGVAVSPVGNGSKTSPKTASINVANNVSKLALESIVTADANASPTLFADSSFTNSKNTLDLTETDANHAYISVKAEDGTLCYYYIAIYRGPTPASSWFETTDTFTKGTNITLVFVADKDFSLYDHIEVDSKTPTASEVPVVSGSTRATIQTAYLETLSAGSHTVELFFTDNTSASGTFQIKAAGSGAKDALAKTGDTAPIASVVFLAFVSLAVLVLYRTRGLGKTHSDKPQK